MPVRRDRRNPHFRGILKKKSQRRSRTRFVPLIKRPFHLARSRSEKFRMVARGNCARRAVTFDKCTRRSFYTRNTDANKKVLSFYHYFLEAPVIFQGENLRIRGGDAYSHVEIVSRKPSSLGRNRSCLILCSLGNVRFNAIFMRLLKLCNRIISVIQIAENREKTKLDGTMDHSRFHR